MPNPNDRIFKENFFLSFLPILEKILGIEHIERTIEITEKLQHTLEREPDFVRIVETANEKFILHIEFQVNDDNTMLQRMGEYHSLLLRRYDLPIRHYVIYFGDSPPKMPTQLENQKVFRGFTLKNLKEYKVDDLLDSTSPEEVIMAILADFGGNSPLEVIDQTLQKLKELVDNPAVLSKYTEQLIVISALRNLKVETQQKVKDMALDLDLRSIFKEDIEKQVAREVAAEVAREIKEVKAKVDREVKVKIDREVKAKIDREVKAKVAKEVAKERTHNQLTTAKACLLEGLSIELTSKLVGLSLKEVKEIEKELSKR